MAPHVHPGFEIGEDDRREGNSSGVQAEGVVDADVELLPGEGSRAAQGPLRVQIAGGDVVDLGREESGLEGHDLLALFGRERPARLGMAFCGAVGLVHQVEGDRLPGEGLAAVPHDAAQEGQVRGRRGAPEERELARARKAVGIVHLLERELGSRGNADPDPDQPLVQEHAVGVSTGLDGRDLGKRRVGAVVRPKDRIEAAGPLEALPDLGGRNRPAGGRLMARDAGAPVRAQALEEGIAGVDPARRRKGSRHAGRVDERRQGIAPALVLFTLARSDPGGRRGNHQRNGNNPAAGRALANSLGHPSLLFSFPPFRCDRRQGSAVLLSPGFNDSRASTRPWTRCRRACGDGSPLTYTIGNGAGKTTGDWRRRSGNSREEPVVYRFGRCSIKTVLGWVLCVTPTISSLISSTESGDRSAADALFAALYSELHRLAQSQLARSGSGVTLGATTLLHEAYLDISRRESAVFPDRGRFMAYAAKVMRGSDHRLCAQPPGTEARRRIRDHVSRGCGRRGGRREGARADQRGPGRPRRGRCRARRGRGSEVLLRLLLRRDRRHARRVGAHSAAALGEGAHLSPPRSPAGGPPGSDGTGVRD